MIISRMARPGENAYAAAMTKPTIPALLAALLLTGAPALTASVQAAPAKAATPSVETLLAQSRAAIGRGETELALRLAQSAIVADPARPSSYVALGDVYALAGEADYARSYYESALAIEPSDAGAQKALSALDGRTGEKTARK